MEIDVNETADGRLVSTHDALVDDRWISEQTYQELVALDSDHWQAQQLPTVVDYILAGDAIAYLDLKAVSPKGISGIARQWQSEVKDGQIILACGRGDVLAWIGTNLPIAQTSFLYFDPLLDLGMLSGFMSPTFAHPCFDYLREPMKYLDAEYVARARHLGFGLVSWSENDPDRISQLGAFGFDFVCTDEPALAVETYRNDAGTR